VNYFKLFDTDVRALLDEGLLPNVIPHQRLADSSGYHRNEWGWPNCRIGLYTNGRSVTPLDCISRKIGRVEAAFSPRIGRQDNSMSREYLSIIPYFIS
jgi:hypothetical protein